jgi:hypothetical protein
MAKRSIRSQQTPIAARVRSIEEDLSLAGH